MGFDGKTLIHPGQVEGANTAFAPSEQAVEDARGILEAWDNRTTGVVTHHGRMVESLHVESAQRTLSIHDAIRVAPGLTCVAGSLGRMTEHVALLHDGRVLVDETGALPSFVDARGREHPDHRPGAGRRRPRCSPRRSKLPGRAAGCTSSGPAGRASGRAVRRAERRRRPRARRGRRPRGSLELDPARTPPARGPTGSGRRWFDRVEAWIDARPRRVRSSPYRARSGR